MKFIVSLLVVGLTMTVAIAGENDSTPWGRVGNWEILVDMSLGNGCFMSASYTRGDVIRVGINNTNKNGYVVIGNPDWRSLEVGKQYDLTFEFEGEVPWNGTFRAMKLGEATFLSASFSDAKFLREFAGRTALTISYNGKVITRLPLTGSYAAMKSLIQCQDKVDAISAPASTHSDPFSGDSPRRASDPFAQ